MTLVPDVVLKETAVVRVGNARVGCGNLWEREYTLPDGSAVRGITARLAIGDVIVYVGVGSQLSIDGTRYHVAGIDKPSGSGGLVLLEAIA
jgi:hypothetical protein